MRREHAQELARLGQQIQSLQDSKRRSEDELARETQLRLNDKHNTLDQSKADVREERTRGEHELELLKHRHSEECKAHATASHRLAGELESALQRARLEAHAQRGAVEETLREETARRHQLEEEMPRLTRELERLRPLHASNAELKKDMCAAHDDSSRLQMEVEAAHISIELLGAKELELAHELEHARAKVIALEQQVSHGLQVAEAANKDTENAFLEAQRVDDEKRQVGMRNISVWVRV